MSDQFSHLNALQSRLFREQQRLADAQRSHEHARSQRVRIIAENEIAFRKREIASCEREIAGEYKFLGIEPMTLDEVLSDDDLLAELGA